MGESVKVFLYGRFPEVSGRRSKNYRLNLANSVMLREFLSRIGIPLSSVQLVMVNHRAVGKDAIIRPDDRVSIFGQEYPIFADWLSQRRVGQTVRD
ncbi:MAG: hypothetical protein JRI39_14660 [Deltaproteobacteria bacterium]|nr:hypothetical protein [Deltaproteobacteria bacterium]MBW2084271.1 hypothetical protein [Deltaproteobacteria bacterium]HDM09232.1 hypothetical protein [Desulfobacteraceae bacterium]